METLQPSEVQTPARTTRPKKALDIGQKLHLVRQIIDGVLAPEIAPQLAPYGYSLVDLQAARARHEALITLQQQGTIAHSDAQAAKLAFDQRWQAAKLASVRRLRLARIKLKHDPIAQTKLLLDGDRKRNLAGWINQARSFYRNALSDAAVRQTL